ncbi:polysaccharide deacetylase family protein [Hazenella sp. IB182357]|uniref:Polysaccharide deacetylase family protein n=1 Tax=Polycladospora coralii TaxID=2771432 RepID=A0A926NCV1_9BACL|nr:polysaccharide deacetylase family protein [Polycladospora coralii]MBD1373480.1 polysaccharide deacetylase family protein [Polycladospora coralii]MBS7530784.1 polysaccharide deacetylase family protein [Polycladospora coralii]
MRFPIRVASFFLSVLIVVLLTNLEPITAYVDAVKEDQAVAVFQSTSQIDPLYDEVKQKASEKERKPIDARVDSVWKLIPGLDGREVNIAKTVAKTKMKQTKEIQWVYEEISPEVNLEDIKGQPIYRGNADKKAVSIMVNVAWGTQYLPEMIKIFDEENIKVTFFLDGSWLKKHPQEAKMLIENGHEIGNHAYSHPMMSRLSQQEMQNQIQKTEDLIYDTLGVHSKWFAPPAGDFNQHVVKQAEQSNMKLVLWTLDTVDWKATITPEMMITKIDSKVEAGSLILTHPTDRTVQALPHLIQKIKTKNLKIIPVKELLSSKSIKSIEGNP